MPPIRENSGEKRLTHRGQMGDRPSLSTNSVPDAHIQGRFVCFRICPGILQVKTIFPFVLIQFKINYEDEIIRQSRLGLLQVFRSGRKEKRRLRERKHPCHFHKCLELQGKVRRTLGEEGYLKFPKTKTPSQGDCVYSRGGGGCGLTGSVGLGGSQKCSLISPPPPGNATRHPMAVTAATSCAADVATTPTQTVW